MKNSPERNRQRSAEWRRLNPDLARQQQLWIKFKITLEDYNKRLQKQWGVCAICGSSCLSGRNLAVDHCHTTGNIRGLLCMKCNNGLGAFNDSPELLKKASTYITETKYG